MFDMDFQPTISINNFQEMRDHYKDYLRYHNYSDADIEYMLNEFDTADKETKLRWMSGIGVVLVEE